MGNFRARGPGNLPGPLEKDENEPSRGPVVIALAPSPSLNAAGGCPKVGPGEVSRAKHGSFMDPTVTRRSVFVGRSCTFTTLGAGPSNRADVRGPPL